jgi:hypothetical protein
VVIVWTGVVVVTIFGLELTIGDGGSVLTRETLENTGIELETIVLFLLGQMEISAMVSPLLGKTVTAVPIA